MAEAPSVDAIRSALAGVEDPEIHKPITELGMVKDIRVLDHGKVEVAVYLTVAGCPMKETITSRVTTAVSAVSGVTARVGRARRHERRAAPRAPQDRARRRRRAGHPVRPARAR